MTRTLISLFYLFLPLTGLWSILNTLPIGMHTRIKKRGISNTTTFPHNDPIISRGTFVQQGGSRSESTLYINNKIRYSGPSNFA
ncbi:hypothetical protein GF373_16935 [bacterium]|nr:hypothetical protein [bacterium]